MQNYPDPNNCPRQIKLVRKKRVSQESIHRGIKRWKVKKLSGPGGNPSKTASRARKSVEFKTRERSAAKGAFRTLPISVWSSGGGAPPFILGDWFEPRPRRKYSDLNNCPHQRRLPSGENGQGRRTEQRWGVERAGKRENSPGLAEIWEEQGSREGANRRQRKGGNGSQRGRL